MKMLLIGVIVLVAGFVGYNHMNAKSEHDRAVSTVKTVVQNGGSRADQVTCSSYGKVQIQHLGDISMWSCNYVDSSSGRFENACVLLGSGLPGGSGGAGGMSLTCKEIKSYLVTGKTPAGSGVAGLQAQINAAG